MPSMMIMDAKSVAREGYRVSMAGKPVHAAGIANELAVRWIKYQLSWLVRAVGWISFQKAAALETAAVRFWRTFRQGYLN
jgi:hypothetical protein